MTEYFWIRHAPIAHTGRYTGQTDVEAMLPSSADAIQHIPTNALWYTSPLKRCVQTAHWLMQAYGLDLSLLRNACELKEQHFGVWEGQLYDEIWKNAQHRYDWSAPELVRPENGESFEDLCARTKQWLCTMHAAHPQKTLIIITHSGVIRAALHHYNGISMAQALATSIDYLSVTHTSSATSLTC